LPPWSGSARNCCCGRRADTALRGDVAQACLALADLVEVTFARDQQPTPGRTQAARTAVSSLRRRFLAAAPHRPSGPTSRRAALGSVVDELDRLPSLLAAPAQVPGADASPEETAAAVSGPWSRAAVPDVIGIRRLSGRGPRLEGRGPGLEASADSGEG
jgi:hypothetical protein